MANGNEIPRLGYDYDYGFQRSERKNKQASEDDDDEQDSFFKKSHKNNQAAEQAAAQLERNEQPGRAFNPSAKVNRHSELHDTIYDNDSLDDREAVIEKDLIQPKTPKQRTSIELAAIGSNQLKGIPTDHQFSSQAHAKVFSDPDLNTLIADFHSERGGNKKSRKSRRNRKSRKSKRSRKSRRNRKSRRSKKY
jgi:hypothetical protein